MRTISVSAVYLVNAPPPLTPPPYLPSLPQSFVFFFDRWWFETLNLRFNHRIVFFFPSSFVWFNQSIFQVWSDYLMISSAFLKCLSGRPSSIPNSSVANRIELCPLLGRSSPTRCHHRSSTHRYPARTWHQSDRLQLDQHIMAASSNWINSLSFENSDNSQRPRWPPRLPPDK